MPLVIFNYLRVRRPCVGALLVRGGRGVGMRVRGVLRGVVGGRRVVVHVHGRGGVGRAGEALHQIVVLLGSLGVAVQQVVLSVLLHQTRVERRCLLLLLLLLLRRLLVLLLLLLLTTGLPTAASASSTPGRSTSGSMRPGRGPGRVRGRMMLLRMMRVVVVVVGAAGGGRRVVVVGRKEVPGLLLRGRRSGRRVVVSASAAAAGSVGGGCSGRRGRRRVHGPRVETGNVGQTVGELLQLGEGAVLGTLGRPVVSRRGGALRGRRRLLSSSAVLVAAAGGRLC